MKNYKMTIQYDGTRYNGWQKQGNTKNTIQERFENVLHEMCGKKVEIYASGRTDAGVHAKAQVANFVCNARMTCKEMMDYLNHYLPADILVTSLEEVEERFHSRLCAVSKTYEYQLSFGKPDVFIRKYVYQAEGKCDIEKMRRAGQKLLGKHDFKGFSSVSKTKKSTVRTIYSIDMIEEEGLLKIRINGSGFLYNMVRIIAGTLLLVGTGKLDEDVIDVVLENKVRSDAGPTLPACGLTLVEVNY